MNMSVSILIKNTEVPAPVKVLLIALLCCPAFCLMTHLSVMAGLSVSAGVFCYLSLIRWMIYSH